ncbi:hypothetical protein HF1_03010 [Mycoplasma haemofelis str. Langford 1]|uniref:Uncharacterized protein n=1 Tax=Mycoplasma haemofelis (strain Langford 1) TaxID=941640 RepID=E8ZGN8_MYCHL|nr:hypothetical protein [Mycoplasma haemofelis]CBY92309.1 hypothetical protein HF1_03010 [Mycoplasma haemofelis str. Langford 1]
MTALTKAASATAVAGTAAGGGIYFGTDLLKSKKVDISSLMKEVDPQKRFITATSTGGDSWKAAYKAYRESGKDVWGLGVKTASPETLIDATTEFLAKCKSNGKVKVSGKDDPLYKQVLAYCTRDTTVRDLIEEGKTGRKLLDSSDTGNDKESGWEDAWTAYRTKNHVEGGTSQNPWEVEGWDNKKTGNTLPTDYKTKCAEKAKQPAYRLEDENYKNVLAWCTK